MYYFIYKTTNLINNKIYIGKHTTSNLDDGYLGSGPLLQKAIAKYGIENFKRDILCFCESQEELCLKEREYVNEDFLKRDDVYNLKLGGDGGWDYINKKLTKEIRSKCASSWVSKPENLEMVRQKSKDYWNNIDEKTKNEHKHKISIGIKKYYETNPGTFTGKKHTDESKNKISKYLKEHQCQVGSRNSQYGKHWWKDPNDKTKSLSIKDGDPVPEGWVRGRWLEQFKNIIPIYNDKTNKCRRIKINSEDDIPPGWHLFKRSDGEFYDIHNKELIFKCKWCGAKKIKKNDHKVQSECKNKNLCHHCQPVKKLIKYFNFDPTAIGTERYYEEYRKAAMKFFKMLNSSSYHKLAEQINWENKSISGLGTLKSALSKIFPEYIYLV